MSSLPLQQLLENGRQAKNAKDIRHDATSGFFYHALPISRSNYVQTFLQYYCDQMKLDCLSYSSCGLKDGERFVNNVMTQHYKLQSHIMLQSDSPIPTRLGYVR